MKNKSSTWGTRIISLILFAIFVFQSGAGSFTVKAHAKEITNSSENVSLNHNVTSNTSMIDMSLLSQDDIPSFISSERVKENNHVLRLNDEETENTIVYLNANGTKTMYIMDFPIKFTSTKGESVFYDLTVRDNGNNYTITSSDIGFLASKDVRCVVFQHDEYDTVDDVVVEFVNGDTQMCYQVKHNIETAAPRSLTFGSMLEASEKKCLFEAIFQGWQKASASSGLVIKPVLFTNRIICDRRTRRSINGKSYQAYAIDQFISKMHTLIEGTDSGSSLVFTDDALKCQWDELHSALPGVDANELVDFLRVFQIKGNERSLEELKQSLLTALCETFACEQSIAIELFGRLLVGVSEWTTTGRKSREVTVEDVYSVLAIGEDIDESQHRLAYPYPFFKSRRSFCETLVKQIENTQHKVVFLSGEPGSGKTSTISFLQSEYNLFLLRYVAALKKTQRMKLWSVWWMNIA